jgi:hypothetical protein
MGYYLKIRFKEKYNGRKIWYFNNTYLCDCINTTFATKEDAAQWITEIMSFPQYPYLRGKNIESITIHKTR